MVGVVSFDINKYAAMIRFMIEADHQPPSRLRPRAGKETTWMTVSSCTLSWPYPRIAPLPILPILSAMARAFIRRGMSMGLSGEDAVRELEKPWPSFLQVFR